MERKSHANKKTLLEDINAHFVEKVDKSEIDVQKSHQYKDKNIVFLLDNTIVSFDYLDPELFDIKNKENSHRIYIVNERLFEELKNYVAEKMLEEIRLTEDEDEEEEDAKEVDNTEVYHLINNIFISASRKEASDIHILTDVVKEGKKKRKITLIKFRIDGRLRIFETLPGSYAEYIINKIKIMGGMDVSKKYIPQDGKIIETIDSERIEFRVSTLYSVNGESVVLRIQKESGLDIELDDLGFEKSDLEKYKEAFLSPHGMILNVGATGQGKTTTFYLTIEELKKAYGEEKKISTVEDPVERVIEGVTQHPVNEKQGATYATVLKSLLRQDPDVIMVGEIRDEETAKTAVSAALTGHLVLSTLHASDSFSAVPRLRDMGIHDQLIASTVIGILSQRLARKLCPSCKKKVTIPKNTVLKYHLDFNEGFVALGCDKCDYTGVKGRTAVIEFLPFVQEIKDAIAEALPDNEIREKAKDIGFSNLWENGLKKVKRGEISLEELLDVIKPDEVLNKKHKKTGPDIRIIHYPENKIPIEVEEKKGYVFDISQTGISFIFDEPVLLELDRKAEVKVENGVIEFEPKSYGKFGKKFILAGRYNGDLEKFLR